MQKTITVTLHAVHYVHCTCAVRIYPFLVSDALFRANMVKVSVNVMESGKS